MQYVPTHPIALMGERLRPMVACVDEELFEVCGPVASGPPLHAHPWAETFVVLQGAFELRRGEQVLQLQAGEALRVPASTPHTYRRLTEGARLLAYSVPARAGAFYDELAQALEHGFDPAVVGAIAARHAITLIPRLFPSSVLFNSRSSS